MIQMKSLIFVLFFCGNLSPVEYSTGKIYHIQNNTNLHH